MDSVFFVGGIGMTIFADWMAHITALLADWGIFRQSVSTFVLIFSFFIVRFISVMAVRRWNAPSSEEKRRWIVQIKNASLIIFAAALFGIWATEVRTLALSMVAAAAALAISTKEIIQCFLGGLYIASARPFELGDRIEVSGFRGEVMDQNFLSTTLWEVGPWKDVYQLSGRQIVIPNSVFLANPVQNQSLQQEYVLQTVRLILLPGEDWQKLEQTLLTAANAECAEFIEPALRAMNRVQQKEGLEFPRIEPRVSFQYDETGRLHATLRFPTPIQHLSRTEQRILRKVIASRPVPPLATT